MKKKITAGVCLPKTIPKKAGDADICNVFLFLYAQYAQLLQTYKTWPCYILHDTYLYPQ